MSSKAADTRDLFAWLLMVARDWAVRDRGEQPLLEINDPCNQDGVEQALALFLGGVADEDEDDLDGRKIVMPHAAMGCELALVLCTGHLTEATKIAMNRCDGLSYLAEAAPRIEQHQYGWIVFLTNGDARGQSLAADYPDLAACIAYAVARDVSFLVFDADGQRIDELGYFEDEA